MNTAVDERTAFTTTIEENQREIREMIMYSYQDILNGKGRDYKEFFAELESRYKRNV